MCKGFGAMLKRLVGGYSRRPRPLLRGVCNWNGHRCNSHYVCRWRADAGQAGMVDCLLNVGALRPGAVRGLSSG